MLVGRCGKLIYWGSTMEVPYGVDVNGGEGSMIYWQLDQAFPAPGVARQLHMRAEPEPEDSVAHSVAPVAEAVAPPVAEAKVQDTVTSVTVNRTDGEVRIARYDYTPEKGDEAQIKISANDKIRVFQVTESGWAAGVRLCPKTMKEEGDAGWFPAGYLEPLQGANLAQLL
eukprot:Skav208094  [mRNA]  locus=scaffold1681:146421:151451:- [translate_table: standard]